MLTPPVIKSYKFINNGVDMRKTASDDGWESHGVGNINGNARTEDVSVVDN